MGDFVQYLFIAAAVAACGIWLVIAVRFWAPAARARGGYWYLEALFLVAGPVALLATFLESSPTAVAHVGGQVSQGVTAVSAALAAVAVVKAHATPRRGAGPIVWAVVAYYAALWLSGGLGVVPSLPLSYTVSPLIVLAFLCHGEYTFDWLLRTALVYLRIAVLACFAAIWVFPAEAWNYEEARTFFGLHRLAGIAGHPNGLAAIAALGLILEARSKSRVFWTLPFIAALLLAQSSTGYVIAGAGLLVVLWVSKPMFRNTLILGGFAATLASLFFLGPVSQLAVDALTGDKFTFNGRERIWNAALHGFELSPVVGYGPELLSADYRALYLPNFDAATHAHNQFVQVLSSAGLVGITALAALFIILVVTAFRTSKASGGLTLGLVIFLVLRCMSETPLKPGSPGFSILTVATTVSLVAVAWSDREPPSKRVKRTQRRAAIPTR
ncbi:O-antigen ligase-like membrane protein [Arthrobacter sp. AG367]|uniref:O-antigen ligase family protein n=1 Tax=Arthrobacter sp. AG367 TaxID=2572909 RepID=UPI0011A4783A|nr:O-antigen ligase family protein [Arthrobacter sp. AG367]TWD53180.1 O-antigen ligase-like membrane protein [Arthrobacter sp. AG367]